MDEYLNCSIRSLQSIYCSDKDDVPWNSGPWQLSNGENTMEHCYQEAMICGQLSLGYWGSGILNHLQPPWTQWIVNLSPAVYKKYHSKVRLMKDQDDQPNCQFIVQSSVESTHQFFKIKSIPFQNVFINSISPRPAIHPHSILVLISPVAQSRFMAYKHDMGLIMSYPLQSDKGSFIMSG